MSEQPKMITGLAAELLMAKGMAPINRNPGVTWVRLDEKWTMAVNGHGEAHVAHSPNLMEATLEAYEFGFWFSGWFFGALRPYMEDENSFAERGVLGAGEVANEQELVRVLEKALREAQGKP